MASADDLCDGCGHPRRLHVHCNSIYPALCTYAYPQDVDAEPRIEDACWCLEFVEPAAADSPLTLERR